MRFEQGQPNRTSSQKGLLLVDGHAYAYRAFYAIQRLTGPDGRPTNALLGFTKTLRKLIDWLTPTHAAVVWDGGMSAQRLEALPAYKANRPEMPDDLHSQISELQRYLPVAGLSSVQIAGVEADDCLAAIAKQAVQQEIATWIASSDKDFMQLARPGLGLINPSDSPLRIWSEQDVIAKTGVRPDQVVDWLSLIGDTVDNIPGVPGIGLKTATKLLVQFGTVVGIYSRIADVEPPRVREALLNSADLVARNQKLIRLDESVGQGIAVSDLVLRKPDLDGISALHQEWGFRPRVRSQPELCEREQDLFAAFRE